MKCRSEISTTVMDSVEREINILIAEDNILNQKIIAILIKRMGWSYKIVADGVEAVSECLSGAYDLVLMDIDMPLMNGWDASMEIRKANMNIPIIALTAYSEESFRKKSFESGMDYFLSKPYNKEEIYDTIRKCIRVI